MAVFALLLTLTVMTEPEQKHTDKALLVKGLKRLALSIPVIILSAYLIRLAVINKENLPMYIFTIPGIICMILAIYLIFIGIRTVMRSIF